MKTHRAKPFFPLTLALLAALTPALARGQVTPITPEEIVTTSGTEPAFAPAIAATPDGDFLVAWRAGQGQTPLPHIFVRRIDDSGQPLGEPAQVSEAPVTSRITGPSMAINFEGTPMVVWQGIGPDLAAPDFSPILGRFLDPLGNPTARVFTIAERGREPRIAALSNGFFVVVWESLTPDLNKIEVRGRLYDRFAVPFGPVFRVPRRQSFSFQGGPEVAGSPDGGFVVVWERGQRRPEIVGRLFDNFGVARGDEFLIDNRPRVTQPAVAYAPDGQFTVVWTRVGVVYGRRYNANGRPQGDAFAIAATPNETRIQPVIAFDAEGNSVVAWNRTRQPTAAAQAFDADGRFAGPHFLFTKSLVNFPPGIQVTFLTGGRLAAVWSGRDLPFLGGALQIVERIFELDLP